MQLTLISKHVGSHVPVIPDTLLVLKEKALLNSPSHGRVGSEEIGRIAGKAARNCADTLLQ